eukprot:301967_1
MGSVITILRSMIKSMIQTDSRSTDHQFSLERHACNDVVSTICEHGQCHICGEDKNITVCYICDQFTCSSKSCRYYSVEEPDGTVECGCIECMDNVNDPVNV